MFHDSRKNQVRNAVNSFVSQICLALNAADRPREEPSWLKATVVLSKTRELTAPKHAQPDIRPFIRVACMLSRRLCNVSITTIACRNSPYWQLMMFALIFVLCLCHAAAMQDTVRHTFMRWRNCSFMYHGCKRSSLQSFATALHCIYKAIRYHGMLTCPQSHAQKIK